MKGLSSKRTSGAFLNQIAKDFISSQKDNPPFFLWLHYMDVHPPYMRRDNFQENYISFKEYIAGCSSTFLAFNPGKKLRKVVKRHLKLTKELYDEGIKYTDKQIGNLMSFLKEKGIYDDCIIVFAADHGNGFLKHGGGSHQPKLYNDLLHVPLFIKIPGKSPKIIKKPVSLIDLAPTLCDILNIERDPSFKGKNLFDETDSLIFHQSGSGNKKVIFSRKMNLIKDSEIENINQCKLGCRFKDWKYILNYGTGSEELYNLSVDPEEENNLVHSELDILFQARKIIQEFEEKNPPFSLISPTR